MSCFAGRTESPDVRPYEIDLRRPPPETANRLLGSERAACEHGFADLQN